MESSTQGSQTERAEGKIIDVGHLLAYLQTVKDGRKRRGMRYRLEIILVLFILAKLCGQNKIYGIADWVQQQSEYLIAALQLRYMRLPHNSTYRRVLTDEIDAEELERVVGEYLSQLPRKGQDTVIAIDGKTVRGTITLEDPFGLHLLAAYLPGEGIVLMQMVVEKDKENEIVVAPKLLECLDLRQKVVVGDAMHTQRQLSIQIVAAEGDFVWIVKDNQPNTREAIERLFAPVLAVRRWIFALQKPPKNTPERPTRNDYRKLSAVNGALKMACITAAMSPIRKIKPALLPKAWDA